MSRTMPTECEHGEIVDWGDFGPCQGDCDHEGDCPNFPDCPDCMETRMTPEQTTANSDSPLVTVEQWWLDELLSALDAATTIGMRSCRPGDGLHYSNHDRLLRIALANGWTKFDQFRSLDSGRSEP